MTHSSIKQSNFNPNGVEPFQIKEWDQKHYLHPWAEISKAKPKFGIITEGKGVFLYDETGKKYLDGPGGMWCVNLGYGREEIASAVSDQLLKLPYTSPWTSTTEPAAILAKRIAEKTPSDLNNVFFSTCGSTAIDTAIRFVHFYNNIVGKKNKKIIVAREKGYHGSTYLSASVSGKERDKRDKTRKVSPLLCVSDAIVYDNSKIPLKTLEKEIIEIVEKKYKSLNLDINI